MSRLVKGAKWTYGWVVVGQSRVVPIPPGAWRAYGFQVGGEAIFTPGSSTSGGFGISTPGLLAQVRRSTSGPRLQVLGRSRFAEGWVTAPSAVEVESGAQLLVVRGSGRALGFVARGPIYEEALKHPELTVHQITPRLSDDG